MPRVLLYPLRVSFVIFKLFAIVRMCNAVSWFADSRSHAQSPPQYQSQAAPPVYHSGGSVTATTYHSNSALPASQQQYSSSAGATPPVYHSGMSMPGTTYLQR